MSTHRYLTALPQGKNQVSLSWRFFSTDAPDAPFHIERRRPNDTWQQITETPITQSTDFQDQTPKPTEYEYRVLQNGTPSEAVNVDSSKNPSNLAIEFPLQYKPELFPVRSATGDLENNGQFGFVVVETEQDLIYVCAYSHSGKLLWKYDTKLPARGGWDGRTYHVPITVRDINNDGRSEVVFHRGPGASFPENRYKQAGPDETLIAVDGQTGDIVWEVPWPATRARVMQTIGALDGPDKPLTIVVQDETYRDVLLTAFNGTDGSIRWQVNQERGAGHNLDIDDIDGDGLMEVICGGICYNPDGTIRWQAEPFGHTDVSKPAKFLPDHPGLQMLYLVEKENPGVYLVDNQGNTIWKVPYGHAHWSWIARYPIGEDQLMIHAAEKGKLLYFPIFYPNGQVWMELSKRQAHRFAAVGWSADGNTNFARRDACHIVRINEQGEEVAIPKSELPSGAMFGRQQLAVDIIGDFRENFGCVDYENATFCVAQNPLPAGRRAPSPTEDTSYLHERAQVGSGYYTYIAPPKL
ncbi:MAG: PQQ-binding-like beta-propeller repeat protein [Candidatus Latescibacteria bacterium]|nr:PQQ-binding-like beta-propeller repeat protein [Candidatus Latescibacterota bacterium]